MQKITLFLNRRPEGLVFSNCIIFSNKDDFIHFLFICIRAKGRFGYSFLSLWSLLMQAGFEGIRQKHLPAPPFPSQQAPPPEMQGRGRRPAEKPLEMSQNLDVLAGKEARPPQTSPTAPHGAMTRRVHRRSLSAATSTAPVVLSLHCQTRLDLMNKRKRWKRCRCSQSS